MPDAARECPFLVCAVADRRSMRRAVRCCRLADDWLRAPTALAVTCICSTRAYLCCPTFLARSTTGRRRGPGGTAAA